MRKPAFCICENKGTHQLHGNRTADQHPCFRYIEISVIIHFAVSYSLNFQALIHEPRCEKTSFLHMRKQRHRSVPLFSLYG